ncbi:hypothetical protein BGZ65_009564, partial [Modicella reniformis]
METTQSFRLIGTSDIKRINCHNIAGQTIVLWEDIKQVFRGINHVQSGDDVIRIRISTEDSVEPPMVTPSLSHRGSEASINHPTDGPSYVPDANRDVEGLQAISQSPPADTSHDDANVSTMSSTPLPNSHSGVKSASKLTFKQVVALAQKKAHESEVEQRLISSMPPDIGSRVRTSCVYGSIVQAIKDGEVEQSDQLMSHLQELKVELTKNTELTTRNTELMTKNIDLTSNILNLTTKNSDLMTKVHELTTENNVMATQMMKLQESLNAKQEEMKQLQIQALNQLSLLQNRVHAIMTQTYELHEYPIPRLFVVLPRDSSRWDNLNPFSNKFRLYFLCECGEHTKSTNSKIPHHIHLAKHEGYDITRPTEFFKQYGPYVLTIMKMLKFGISVAGIVVPAVSLLTSSGAIDQANSALQQLAVAEQMEKNEALEGADLRKLDTFLESKDENKVLGNLYRTVTTERHVKWVCIDHYRENYQAKAVKAFRDTMDALRGTFYEDAGRVYIYLRSRVEADQFYSALEKTKSVYELSISFRWD